MYSEKGKQNSRRETEEESDNIWNGSSFGFIASSFIVCLNFCNSFWTHCSPDILKWTGYINKRTKWFPFFFFLISRISNSGWPFWILWKQVLWLGEALCHQQRDKACRVCLHGHLQTALQTCVWIWWGILWKPLWSAQSCLPEKAKDHHRSQWRLLF